MYEGHVPLDAPFSNNEYSSVQTTAEEPSGLSRGTIALIVGIGLILLIGAIVGGLWAGGVFDPKTDDKATDTTATTPPGTSTPGSPVSGNGKPQIQLQPAESRYYFGNSCPDDWDDLGEVGFIVPQSQRANFNFKVGGPLPSGGWDWVHPRLCKGDTDMEIPAGLYKFSNKENNRKTGVLWDKNDIRRIESEGAFPLEFGGDYYGNSNYQWIHPYLIPASEKGGYYFADIPTQAKIEEIPKDKSIVGQAGILWHGTNIKKAKDFKVGSDFYGYNFVDGYIREDQLMKS